MKKIYLSLGIVATLGLGLIQTSCKKSPLDDVAIAVNTDVLVAPSIITFENANENGSDLPANFDVTISGSGASKVLSAIGKTTLNSTFEVQNGYLIFNLQKGEVPSEDNPIILTIKGKPTGFEPIEQTISITGTEEQYFNIQVIESTNLPSSISETNTTATIADGAFTADKTVATATTDSVTQATNFIVEAGTIIRGTDGNPLTGTNLSIESRFYDNTAEGSELIPGGTENQKMIDENGEESDDALVSPLGFLQIEMKAGDKIVKNFSKPVSAEMELKVGEINPDTDEEYKAGDSIEKWSRDDVTGVYKFEGYAHVFNEGNKLVARFTFDHLSGWAVGKITKAVKSKVKFTFLSNWAGKQGKYEMLFMKGSKVYATYKTGALRNNDKFTIKRVPKFNNLKVVIINKITKKRYTHTAKFSYSKTNSMTIDISSLNMNTVDINLKYKIICEKNPKFKPNANAFLVVREANSNRQQIFRTGADGLIGSLNFSLVDGKEYTVETIGLDGKPISYTTVFDISKLQATPKTGFKINKLEYNPSTKNVIMDVTYTTSKC